MDEGEKRTEEMLAELEKKIAEVYKQAAEEMSVTIKEYFDSFAKRDKEMQDLRDKGEITEEKYKLWRLAQIGRGKRLEAMKDALAERITQANEVAIAYVNDATPGIYSLNYNYTAYTIELVADNVSFTLFDEQTVKRLIAEDPDMLPYYPEEKAVKRDIDLAYGRRQIQANITSGILQGKSVYKIADDLQEAITNMSRTSAVRAARTAFTGAQNAGRQAGYEAAVQMGIELKKQWIATLDLRTRHSHAMLDEEKVDYNAKFSNGLMFPGDPSGAPSEVYNCRCTTVAFLPGVDEENVQRRARDPITGRNELISDMNYTEWYEMKQNQNPEAFDLALKKQKYSASDEVQYQEYRSVLGKEIPKTFAEFQEKKYTDIDWWDTIKEKKQQTVFVKNAPCETTPKKFTGYFLKESAKHADEFFDVRYTSDDALRLRYDMARQFDMSKAVEFKGKNGGARTFNLYMELGVTKKRSFVTGWIVDNPGDTPRIVTAFRKNQEDSNDQ